MRKRLGMIFLIALIVAAGGTYIVYRMVQARTGPNPALSFSRVLVASRDLQVGTMLREEDVSVERWPGKPVPGVLLDKKAALGRGVVSAMYRGEPILEKRIAQPGAGAGLAAIIPAGMRACAVKVNDVVGVAGFVLPGMRVDVLVSGTPPGARPETGPKVRTLLQNIEVLSAGTNLQKDGEGKPVQVQVVNLLVTPEQAEVLSLASNETRIQLVLRNPLDTRTEQVSGTAMANLFGESTAARTVAVRKMAPDRKPAAQPVSAQPPATPAAEVFLVEVINGSKRTEAKFPAGRGAGQ
jgi:pilus assembly protein CpaB